MERKLLIIYTGGTIGMINDPETNSLVPFDFSMIEEQVPELRRFNFVIDSHSFSPIVDSSDIDSTVWVKLANIIYDNYKLYDGFVILHGTDTMAYSASALSFMLNNLAKPVIFTGSQLPLSTIRSDGKENIITAVEIASAYQNNKAIVPEVCIFFQNELFRGNRTTKYNVEHFRAFRSDNYPPLAEVGIHIKFNKNYIYNISDENEFYISTNLDNNVGLLKIFPGMKESFVDAVLNTKNMKALVLETFGAGNAPTNSWFHDKIQKAIDKGIIILNVSQCLAGSVLMNMYATGIHLKKLGVLSAKDMTTEAAITKLMCLLGNYKSVEEIKLNLKKSLKGEISL